MDSSVEITTLATRHNWFFYASLMVAMVPLVLTYFVWKSGNNLQDAQRQQANIKIGEARKAAAEASENSEILKKENLKLGIELERERQERLKLARRVGERTIYPEEKDFIVSKLRAYPNQKITINIWASNDPEVNAFAEQIMNVLKEAGWNVIPGDKTYLISPSPPFYAIRCRIFKQPSLSDFLSVLEKLDIDHWVQRVEAMDVGDDYLIIDIGQKRPYVTTLQTK